MAVPNQKEGYENVGDLDALQYLIGYHDMELVDASDEDKTPARIRNCRAVKVDQAGIIKVRYVNAAGQSIVEVMHLPAGQIHSLRNVQMVYRNYDERPNTYGGPLRCTAACYGADGNTIPASLKLLR